jgi:hypothetical protein
MQTYDLQLATITDMLTETGETIDDLMVYSEQLEHSYFYGHVSTPGLWRRRSSIIAFDGNTRQYVELAADDFINKLLESTREYAPMEQ